MSKLTQFDYLLNAMEAAAQQENPASYGYAQKRQALYAYVRGLENRPSPLDDLSAPASPAPLPPVEVGDVVLLESGGVEYVRTKHAEDYWTGADAEGFPDVAERRKARILAIYRDPLWRRPAPMPTTGDES